MSRIDGAITRRRILIESSRLFASRGYHGTATRDIAAAIGIRQPSLFHHFAAKHEILIELLDEDLGSAVRRLEAVESLDGPWAQRLYAYLRCDTEAILQLPYDVRGLYNDEVLAQPEFRTQADLRARLHAQTQRIVANGMQAGEFSDEQTPRFVQHAITGLILEAVRERGSRPRADAHKQAREIADFILRAVLRDPTQASAVRAAGLSLMQNELLPALAEAETSLSEGLHPLAVPRPDLG